MKINAKRRRKRHVKEAEERAAELKEQEFGNMQVKIAKMEHMLTQFMS